MPQVHSGNEVVCHDLHPPNLFLVAIDAYACVRRTTTATKTDI
jgi:hypothetical protein